MSKQKETQMTENAKLYELGFHIVSTVTEDKVTDAFNVVSDIITNNGGSIVRSEQPKAIKLAYTIITKIAGKNTRFNEAYFAWIKFTASTEDVEKIKVLVDENADVLRYIVVKTINDDEKSTAKLAAEIREASKESTEEVKKEVKEEVKEEVVEEKTEEESSEDEKEEESKDDIDQAIDELVEEK